VETVTVAAVRSSSFDLSGTTLMIVSVVVVAVVAFAVVMGLKYFRKPHSARRVNAATS
jgi:hypothetical protein